MATYFARKITLFSYNIEVQYKLIIYQIFASAVYPSEIKLLIIMAKVAPCKQVS